jgi:hypothetical protein
MDQRPAFADGPNRGRPWRVCSFRQTVCEKWGRFWCGGGVGRSGDGDRRDCFRSSHSQEEELHKREEGVEKKEEDLWKAMAKGDRAYPIRADGMTQRSKALKGLTIPSFGMNKHEQEGENMAPKRKKKDYIGFIMEAEKSEELSKEFFSKCKKPPKELQKFFHAKGFTEIEEPHCKEIKQAMKPYMKGAGPKPGDPPCPPNARY